MPIGTRRRKRWAKVKISAQIAFGAWNTIKRVRRLLLFGRCRSKSTDSMAPLAANSEAFYSRYSKEVLHPKGIYLPLPETHGVRQSRVPTAKN